MTTMGTSLTRLQEIGVPSATTWSTLILDCPVCHADAAETIGVAGGGDTEASVIMCCEECETVYLTPPPGPSPSRPMPLPERSPTARQLRRWARGLRSDARAIHVDAAGALPERGSFELVVLDHALECALEPGALLRSAADLLAAGGRILVVTDNARSSCFAIFGGRHWTGYAPGRARQQLTAVGLERLCAQCGLHARRVSTQYAAQAWLDSARCWLLDWGIGRVPSALLAGRWFVPALLAGMVESLAMLRGRGVVLVAELERA